MMLFVDRRNVLRSGAIAVGAAVVFCAAAPAWAGYSVTTSANTGRGYARGCAAGYNTISTGASFVVNDGSNANCISGGGPGVTTFNNQVVTVTGSTDATGTLTASHDESSNFAFPAIYGSAQATASADLATGQVHLFATAEYSAGDAGAAAIAAAGLNDTLHFTIAGAAANTVTLVPVSFAFDGMFTPGRPLGPSATLYYNFSFGNARAYEFGDYGAGYYNGTSYPTFSFPATQGQTSGWQSASFTSYDPQDTRFSGIYAITGATADIPIAFGLQIIAGNNVTLDYSHTGSVSIGHVDGVSYTSDSGVFLTAAPTVGGVPEPFSWTLLVAGFAAVGTMARRQRRTVSA
jgi:hypothetical protein